MKAAVLNAPENPLELQTRDEPSPGRDEVLIRVRACGVCAGDLLLQDGAFPGARYPVVPGHEIAGVVESVGEDATSPVAQTMTDAFPGLAVDGTMVVLGTPPEGPTLSPLDLIMGRRRVMGSLAGSRKDLRDSLGIAADREVRPRVTPMSSRRCEPGADPASERERPWAAGFDDELARTRN